MSNTNQMSLEVFAKNHNLDLQTLEEAFEDTRKVIHQVLLEGQVPLTEEFCIQAFIVGHNIRMKHYQDILDNKDGIKDRLAEMVYDELRSSIKSEKSN